LLDLLYPPFFITWGIVLVVVALRRGLPRVALAVALVLALAPLSAELLKPLLAHPHDQLGSTYITNASWPSGHATAVLILVWCALLVSSPAHRRVIATIGTVLAGAVGVSLLILAWHMPSDVVGGYLLATFWAALALAALGGLGGTVPRKASAQTTSGELRHAPRGARAVRAGVPQ
jgi:membrane-associated phospholipid phosphatase